MIRDFTKLRGLDTSTSNLAAQGESLAFEVLRNCVMRTAGVIESRRGYDRSSGSYPSGSGAPDTVMHWSTGTSAGQIYAHTASNKLVVTEDGSGFTTLTGTFTPPSSRQRMRSAAAQRHFYITTDAGPYRSMSVGADDFVRAGLEIPSIDWAVSRASTATGGFLANDSAALYRAWMVITDAQGLEIVGEVSDGVLIQNPALANFGVGGIVRTGGTTCTVTTSAAHGFKVGDVPTVALGVDANFTNGAKTILTVPNSTTFTYSEAGANVGNANAGTFAYGASQGSLRIRLPSGTTTSHILRVSRTRSVSGANTTPQPDTFLVYETLPTSTDVSNGYVDVLDNTPDSLLGPICYASPGAEGALRNNGVPPVVNDLCAFNDCLLGANTRERHRFEIQLLATGGSAGLVSGDALVIVRNATTVTLTFGTGYSSTAPTVYSGGTVTNDIERTARSLVAAINSNSSAATAGVRARYISSVDEAPGRVAIEATTFTTASFTVACSARPLAWQPTLGTTPSTRTSTQALRANRVVFSKPGLPDAFPAIQYVDVGEADDAILRIVALNDSVIVLKQRSVWVLTGSWPFFNAKLLDPEVQTDGPDTCAALGNQVHVLTSQGVAVVTESGVGLIGLPVLKDTTEHYPGAIGIPWGCAYAAEHSYLLAIPRDSSSNMSVLVWNQMLKTWTGPLTPCTPSSTFAHGIVALPNTFAQSKLVIADGGGVTLRWEEKTFSNADYADDVDHFTTTVTANDGAGTLTCTTTNIAVGDTLQDSSNNLAVVVTAVGASTVTVAPVPSTDFTGLCAILKNADCLLVSQPIRTPATAEKSLRQVRIHWRRGRVQYADVGVATGYDSIFATDTPLSISGDVPTVTRAALLGVIADYDDTPYVTGPRSDPCDVDARVVRGDSHRLVIRIRGARNDWAIEGISLVYGDGSTERTRRV